MNGESLATRMHHLLRAALRNQEEDDTPRVREECLMDAVAEAVVEYGATFRSPFLSDPRVAVEVPAPVDRPAFVRRFLTKPADDAPTPPGGGEDMHPGQEDFVMVFSDEHGNDRPPEEMAAFVERLRYVAAGFGFDIYQWGTVNSMTDSLIRRREVGSLGVPVMPIPKATSGTVNSEDRDVASVGAALADAAHAGGLSGPYHRSADDALARLAVRVRPVPTGDAPIRWLHPTSANVPAIAVVRDVSEMVATLPDPVVPTWRGSASLYPTNESVSEDLPSRDAAITWVQRQLHACGVVECRGDPCEFDGVEMRATRVQDWRCACGHMGGHHVEECRGGGCMETDCDCTLTEEQCDANGRRS